MWVGKNGMYEASLMQLCLCSCLLVGCSMRVAVSILDGICSPFVWL